MQARRKRERAALGHLHTFDSQLFCKSCDQTWEQQQIKPTTCPAGVANIERKARNSPTGVLRT
jgi:hypothetical protein